MGDDLQTREMMIAGMSTQAHTPGPWHATRKFRFVSDLRNRPLAEMMSRPSVEANACLMAAAPELYAALKAILSNDSPDVRMRLDHTANGIAAIAKAEGRS